MIILKKYRPALNGAIIGFAAALLIEALIIRSSQEGAILLAKEYLKRTGIILIALDGGILGGLIGWLYQIYRRKTD
jgi:hypothetical protein